MTAAPRRSVLELLLAQGHARRTLVLGAGCPPQLATSSGADGDATAVDLAVVAPSQSELRQRGWLGAAAATCAGCVADDGLVYVLVPPAARGTARRVLRAEGLMVGPAMLHLPDVTQTRHLVWLGRAGARHAFRDVVPLMPYKRVAVEALLGMGGARVLAATQNGVALLARRRNARPLLDWLRELEGAPAAYRGVALCASRRPDGARAVVHPVAAARERAVVAKVVFDESVAAPGEERRLARLAPLARQAGAGVPEPLCTAHVGGARVLLQTRVNGRIAASLLARRSARLVPVLECVSGWLERWQRLTAATTPLRRELLEREVLAPARRVAPALSGGAAYAAALELRCRAVEGMSVPLTASHNDLTMWNVLIAEDTGLGIVDWESAEEAALPFKDFFYAAVDAVAATGRYADRPGAYDACSDARGGTAATVARLEASMIASLDVAPEIVELSRHACWLGHALNESRSAPRSGPRPFLAIVRRLAGGI